MYVCLHRVFVSSNTTGATSEAGTANPSGAHAFTPGVHGPRSLILYVMFVDRRLSIYPFSFDHCVVCPSSIYGF
jgi:hypothetical protein